MRTILKYAGCLAIIGLPVLFTPQAFAQSGGTTVNASEENSHNTGGHMPDSANYKERPASQNYTSNGTNGYRRPISSTQANYTNTGDGPAERNADPNLNAGGHGGGQAR